MIVTSVILLLLSFFYSPLQALQSPAGYLEKFGYLEPEDPAAATDPDEALRGALLKFQDYYSLPLTGVVDEATQELMNEGRCGLPDIEPSHGRKKRYNYAGRWRKRNLKYVISQYSRNVTQDNINSVIGSAFEMWQNAADLAITRVSDEKSADMVVSFVKGSHSTSRTVHVDNKLSFDGPGGVLAHASFPTVGEIHFDDAEEWLVDNARSEGELGYNLMWAAVHELGHALGLKHTRVRGNVMNAVYKKHSVKALGSDDIAGIRRLYGQPREKSARRLKEAHVTSMMNNVVEEEENEDSCKMTGKVDALLTLGDTVYMFRDQKVWIFDNSSSSIGYPLPISDAFPGITGPITAAMEGTENKVYFFRNKLYWRWDTTQRQLDRGFPRNVAGFGFIRDNVIAAFRWGHNGKGYIFGECRYWRYDFNNKRADPGYPKSTRTWRGIPNDLDAISTTPDGKTYVFKNQSFWQYSSSSYRLLPHPHSTVERWNTCSQNYGTYEDVVAELRSSPSSSFSSFSSFSLALFLASLVLL